MNTGTWECYEDAKRRINADRIKQRFGKRKSARVHAIILRQGYAGRLEYNEKQQFLTVCGGIQPLPILPPIDKEEL